MNIEQELKIKLDILKIIRDCMIPNIADNTVELSTNKLTYNIEKIEAQILVLSMNEQIVDTVRIKNNKIMQTTPVKISKIKRA